ncbi:MAG: DPP IV N-terminal domain-containing protein [bacterium]
MYQFLWALVFLLFSWEAQAYNFPDLKWKTAETEHIYIHYHQGEELTAERLSQVADPIFEAVCQAYDYTLKSKVHVIFQDVFDVSNGGALPTEDLIILWPTHLYNYLRGRSDWIPEVFAHELTHIISLKKANLFTHYLPFLRFNFLYLAGLFKDKAWYAGGGVLFTGEITPPWFSEGIAQYEEIKPRGEDSYREMFLRTSLLEDNLLTIHEMDVFSGKNYFTGEQVYNHGLSLVTYLNQTYGDSTAARLITRGGRRGHPDFDDTLRDVTGKGEEELYQAWKNWLREKYEPAVSRISQSLVAGEREKVFEAKQIDESDSWSEGMFNLYCRPSPDGQWLAFATSRGDEWGATHLCLRARQDDKTGCETPIGLSSSFSWAPDGHRIVAAKKISGSDGYHFDDLYLIDLEPTLNRLEEDSPAWVKYKPGKSKRISRGLRATEPDFSPKGEWIVFIRNGDAQKNLAMIKPDGSNIKSLTHFTDNTQCGHPRWSPDGSRIVFTVSKKDKQYLCLIDPQGKQLIQLTDEVAEDRDPSWIDNDRLLFSSNREGGIFNLYQLDLKQKKLLRLTNCLTGAFSPVITSDGQDIFYSSFSSFGFRIYRLPWGETMQQEVKYQAPAQVPNQAPILNPPRQELHLSSLPYTTTLRPLQVIPELIYDDYDKELKPGIIVPIGDYLSQHEFMGEYFPRSGEFSLSYLNRQFAPGFYAEYTHSKFKEDYLTLDTEKEEMELYRFHGQGFDRVFAEFFYQLSDSQVLGLGWSKTRFKTNATAAKGEEEEGYLIVEGKEGTDTIPITWVWFTPSTEYSDEEMARTELWAFIWRYLNILPTPNSDVHPKAGMDLSFIYLKRMTDLSRLYYAYFPHDEPTSSSIDFNSFFLSANTYFPLPWGDHTLRVHLMGGYTDRNVAYIDEFFGGGWMGLLPFGDFSTESILPGYLYDKTRGKLAIHGETLAIMRLGYQLPLLSHINKKITPFHFDSLYFNLFGDVGNAWPYGGYNGKFVSDVGAELKLKATMLYRVPWNSFIRIAHGFDDPEDKDFRLYVGLGIGGERY